MTTKDEEELVIDQSPIQLCPESKGFITTKERLERLRKDTEQLDIAYIEAKMAMAQLVRTLRGEV